jgi:HEAT repeat protein
MRKSAVGLLLAIATATVALAQARLETLLAKIATYEYGDSREPLAQFTRLAEDSLRSPATISQIEAALLKFLQSEATPAAKDFALRELSRIATDKSVPALAGMLAQPETAEMARYALARIPGNAADDALVRALPKAPGSVRIGIVNSLGQRRTQKSVPALRPLLISKEPGLAEAAAAALSDIGDQTALEALGTAKNKAAGPMRERFTDAYIRCAGRLENSGNKSAALKVYRELIGSAEPERIRIAALAGLAANDPASAVPALTTELSASNLDIQAAAIRLLSGISDPKVTTILVQHFPKLSPPGQIKMLAALADRGDKSATPLFTESLKTPDLRIAALTGLSKLGDASTISVLAEAAATSAEAERDAARTSLYSIRGPAIDPAIVSALQSASGKTKVELIMAAGERGIAPAADLLVKAVDEKDPEIHRESLRALRNVAGPPQIPALLQMLVKSTTTSDRRETAQTLASVLKRSEAANVDAVISTYKTTGEMPARLALLEVLGQTSSDQALPVLQAGLKDGSAEIARGSILALSEWGSPAPLPNLLSVAQSGANPTLQVLALRGYLKLIALPSERSVVENARMLGEAMQLAKQPAEKRTILSLLSTFPSKESLQVAEAATKDQAVATEAKSAVDRINGLLKFQ